MIAWWYNFFALPHPTNRPIHSIPYILASVVIPRAFELSVSIAREFFQRARDMPSQMRVCVRCVFNSYKMRASLAFICTWDDEIDSFVPNANAWWVVVVVGWVFFVAAFCCFGTKGNNGKSANNIIIHTHTRTHASAKVSKQAIKSNVNARPTRKSTLAWVVCACVCFNAFSFWVFEFCCRFTALCQWYFVQSTRLWYCCVLLLLFSLASFDRSAQFQLVL